MAEKFSNLAISKSAELLHTEVMEWRISQLGKTGELYNNASWQAVSRTGEFCSTVVAVWGYSEIVLKLVKKSY